MKLADKLTGMVVVGLALLMLASLAVLRSGVGTVRGNELTLDRAVFAVANASTLTGFQTPITVRDYKLIGQVTIFLLIAGSSLFTLTIGGWSLARVLALPWSDEHLARSTLGIYSVFVLIGATLLIGPGASVWDAVFQAASAFGNAGHVIGSLPGFADWRAHLVLLPLAFVGGVGIPVLLDIGFSALALRRPHPHTIAVLFAASAVHLLGGSLILLAEWMSAGSGLDLRHAFILAATEVPNSRTAGLPLGAFGVLSRSSQWIVLLLMLIGGSTAGTAGGIKATTLYVLGRDSARLIFGKAISNMLGFAVIWVGAYLIIVAGTAIALVTVYPQETGERLLFLAVSAASNAGISHEPLTMTGAGLHILSVAMLFGRFIPLLILWWAAKRALNSDVAATG